MRALSWRGAAGLTARRCLRTAAVPTVLAAAGAWAGARLFPPVLAEADAPGAASPWLVLPIAVAAVVCVATTILFWPSFARGRAGNELVARLHGPRLAGCGAAIAGALLAQLVLVLPLTVGLSRALGAPAASHAHLALVPPAEPVLMADRPRVQFAVGSGHERFGELWLRPLAALPIGPLQATVVEVLADGETLGTMPHGFVETRQLARLPFAARTIEHLELVYRGGTVPLVFRPGTAVLVGSASRPAWSNGALAALVALVPTFAALAFACLARRAGALPTVLAVATILLFVQLVGDHGPFPATMLATMRGHWLPAAGVFPAGAASLAVGSVAMIGSMLLRSGVRR